MRVRVLPEQTERPDHADARHEERTPASHQRPRIGARVPRGDSLADDRAGTVRGEDVRDVQSLRQQAEGGRQHRCDAADGERERDVVHDGSAGAATALPAAAAPL
jgi:hypothetical protein